MEIRQGNIFESETQALINPVNTQGIMGKGLAYQFKIKYPNNFQNYEQKCLIKEVDVGKDLIYTEEKDKIIINFPTKKNWKENSKIEYIEIGLKKLEEVLEKLRIKSVSIPPIGAGNGKLDWKLVKNEIEKFEKRVSKSTNVIIYEPAISESKLSKGHYLIAYTLVKAEEKGIKKEITDLVLQKLIYLGDRNNYFKFKEESEGPFSKLISIQYQKLKEYSKLNNKKLVEIEKELLKEEITKNLQKEKENIENAIQIYINMKNFYSISVKEEIENKVELLSTVIHILKNKKDDEISNNNIYEEMKSWNKRKDKKYSLEDIGQMFDFLEKEKILKKDIFNKYIMKY